MAIYTTEVKTICEQAYLDKIGKHSDTEALYGVSPEVIISEAMDIVLPYSFPVWDGMKVSSDYVKTVILRHYYFREIGLIPVAKWKWKLNTKLCEVMPYLNRVHTALDEMGSVFDTINFTEKLNINRNENEDTTALTKNNETTTENRNTSGNNLHSDTPQDGLEDVVAGRYLSSADVNTGKADSTATTAQDIGNSGNRILTSQDIHNLQRNGFQGDRVDTIKRLAEARISWENMLVSSVGELFMGVLEDNEIIIGDSYGQEKD